MDRDCSNWRQAAWIGIGGMALITGLLILKTVSHHDPAEASIAAFASTETPGLGPPVAAAASSSTKITIPMPLSSSIWLNSTPGMILNEPDKEQYPFRLYDDFIFIAAYSNYAEAVSAARKMPGTTVYYKQRDKPLGMSKSGAPESVRLEAPLIYQMPELERGCEVTSLAMLLQYAGLDVDKMTLAEQIVKDPTPFEIYDNMIHFGNPDDGFVGDIETFDKPGYGVYHHPVMELTEHYLPGRVVDATGSDFDDVLSFVQRGVPVWVITNMNYEKLQDDAFETWDTPDGAIDITYLEHSVLITGYDNDTIYINDPLGEMDHVDRQDFIEAWEQMGRQAISYVL